ncbi:hypothetical protein RvY_01751 [Ramazzottius varieornatus]|uniref:Uncharacterized protein n=1 Tax=Ramazzottius varieornatus TaxID=947166 RepID=A0A1D1UHH6_RAMVA|nr:hypothetical protein RvY_01751 [Ramazzottius varieornatus]
MAVTAVRGPRGGMTTTESRLRVAALRAGHYSTSASTTPFHFSSKLKVIGLESSSSREQLKFSRGGQEGGRGNMEYNSALIKETMKSTKSSG